MSRNEERLGASESTDETASIEEETTKKGLLEWVTSNELVDLPSKGQFYSEDHPLHKKEQVEIKEMTTHEEGILTNKSYIKSGIVIDKLLQSILVDKRIKVNSLLTGDKLAIALAARITGYGKEYKANVPCPACNAVHELEFDLTTVPMKHGVLDEEIRGAFDIRFSEASGTFFFTLPRSNVEVECRLLTGADESRIAAVTEQRKKKKIPENALQEQLMTILVSLNGITDRPQIIDFLKKMPAKDSKYLRVMYGHMVPGVDLSKDDVECPECEAEREVAIPITAEFFWPKQ